MSTRQHGAGSSSDTSAKSADTALGTPLSRLLGVKWPIISAPMGGVAGGSLAAAVTRAGGLGLIGVGYAGLDFIEREFRAAAGARVGFGFISWDLAKAPARLAAALGWKPDLVVLSFGDAAPYVQQIRQSGALLALQVQSVADAVHAAGLGADIVIAQGSEAGGHGASRGLFPLLPAVVDAVSPLPVVAAGGIADGRGLVAALALGASGVLLGTRFIAADESMAPSPVKRQVIEASGDDTVRTRVFDIVRGLDWPEPYTGRALQNAFTRRWHGRERELSEALAEEAPRYADAARAGDLDTALVWAGEGSDLIREVAAASAIVERLVAEARIALARLSG